MRRYLMTLFLLATCFSAPAAPRTEAKPAPSVTDQARLERLAGLARIWGAIKFFHPFLAYRPIDWDRALIETIPRVNAARTSQEYEAAINHLLSFLNDKSTRIEAADVSVEGKTEPPVVEAKDLVRSEDGVLVVKGFEIARAAARNEEVFDEALGSLTKALPQAKSVIIDGRGTTLTRGEEFEDVESFFNELLHRSLPAMLDQDLALGSLRYRIHNGYATQGGVTSGGYYSVFASSAPEMLPGKGEGRRPALVFIVNDRTPPASEILGGLQAAGRAVVLQDGEMAEETGVKVSTLKLPDNIRVRIRLAEVLNPDGSVGFLADKVAAKGVGRDAALVEAIRIARENGPARTLHGRTPPPAVPASVQEKTYAGMEFPAAEYRLLALFRFWNVINYFYPYKTLLDKPWDEVLPRYIPKFEANRDALEYQGTVREMVAEIQDSHGSVRGAQAFDAQQMGGGFLPPVELRSIEGRSVVVGLLDEEVGRATGLRVGDEILAINKESVGEVLARRAKFVAASTPQALRRTLHNRLLGGAQNSKIQVTVRSAEGAPREIELIRSLSIYEFYNLYLQRMSKSLPAFTVLPSGLGYVNLSLLQIADVEKMFQTIRETPATIFDMRGYPNATAWAIAPRLTSKRNVTGALFWRPLREAIMLGEEWLDAPAYTFAQKLPEPKGAIYAGKVVMLIDENAISQSEHTCLFFEAATDVTFIGTPTDGADGDVTQTVLPGGLTVSFSGHGVRHADGRQLQRRGILPDIKVEPTIRGVREGRDEILEAAVGFLQSNNPTLRQANR